MPRLIVRDEFDERIVELDQEVITAGRSKKNAIPIRDEHSSREHCEVRRLPDGFVIVDLNSRNGTLVNGCPVNQHRLRHGDKIEVGDTLMIFTTGESRLEYIQRDTPAHLQAVNKKGGTSAKTKSQSCSLTIVEGERSGEKVALDKLPFTIGRNKAMSLTFQDDRVSGKHAEITLDPDGRYVVKDLNSTNGTLVNGHKVPKSILKSGDVMEIGANKIEFTDPQAPAQGEDRKTPPSLPNVPDAPAGGSSPPPGKAGPGLDREHLSMIVAGVISLAVVGAIYLCLPSILRLFLGTAVGPPPDPTNLVSADPSFERPDPDLPDLFAGWKVSGTLGEQFAADTETASDGRCALRLDSLETGPRSSEMACTYAQEIPVEADKAFLLKGQLRVRNARGLAGCRMTWLDAARKPLGEAWSPLLNGETAWQRISAVFLPPPGATTATLACVGLGAFGKAWFDGLHLSRRAPDPARDFLEVTEARVKLTFDPRGIFSVAHSGKPIFYDAGVRVWTAAGRRLAQEVSALETGFPSTTGNDFQTQVRLLDPDTGGWSKLTLTTITIEGKLSLNYRLELGTGTQVDQVELALRSGPELLKSEFLLGAQEGETTESSSFPRAAGTLRFACGPADGRLTMHFPAPASIQVRPPDGFVEVSAMLLNTPEKSEKVLEFGVDLE